MTTAVVADSLLVMVTCQECPARNKGHRCGSAVGLKMKRSSVLGFVSMRSLLVREVGNRFASCSPRAVKWSVLSGRGFGFSRGVRRADRIEKGFDFFDDHGLLLG